MYKIVKDSIAWYLYMHVCPESKEVRDVGVVEQALRPHERIARDAMEKALIAIEAKDHASACMYVGLASAAFLDAKDTANYKKLIETKKRICANDME